jgi:RNA-directed DNA polymerase
LGTAAAALLLLRQWKQPRTQRVRLLGLDLCPEHVHDSASIGRGPWWNAGPPTSTSLARGLFTRMGLISLLDTQWRLEGAR